MASFILNLETYHHPNWRGGSCKNTYWLVPGFGDLQADGRSTGLSASERAKLQWAWFCSGKSRCLNIQFCICVYVCVGGRLIFVQL
mgnify:CR=1 FL=1